MNQIILELIKNGVPTTVQYNKEQDRLEYIIEGFYKSGIATCYETKDSTGERTVLVAKTRYKQIEIIDSLYDLVYLNYSWFESSKKRFEGWSSPDSLWISLLEQNGLFIKAETKYATSTQK